MELFDRITGNKAPDTSGPRIQFNAEYFHGQKIEFSAGMAFGRKESGEFGELYRYEFSTTRSRNRCAR